MVHNSFKLFACVEEEKQDHRRALLRIWEKALRFRRQTSVRIQQTLFIFYILKPRIGFQVTLPHLKVKVEENRQKCHRWSLIDLQILDVYPPEAPPPPVLCRTLQGSQRPKAGIPSIVSFTVTTTVPTPTAFQALGSEKTYYEWGLCF